MIKINFLEEIRNIEICYLYKKISIKTHFSKKFTLNVWNKLLVIVLQFEYIKFLEFYYKKKSILEKRKVLAIAKTISLKVYLIIINFRAQASTLVLNMQLSLSSFIITIMLYESILFNIWKQMRMSQKKTVTYL